MRADPVLRDGALAVEIACDPFGLVVRRDGHRLVGPIGARVCDGAVHDQFVQLTEGVLAHEDRDDWTVLASARTLAQSPHAAELYLDGGATLTVQVAGDVVAIDLTVPGA